jgi:hypothetical protein
VASRSDAINSGESQWVSNDISSMSLYQLLALSAGKSATGPPFGLRMILDCRRQDEARFQDLAA